MKTIDELTQFLSQALADPAPFRRASALCQADSFYSLYKLQQHLNNPLLSLDWLRVSLKNQVIDLESAALWKTVQRKKLVFIDKSSVQQAVDQGAAVVLEGLDILDPNINQLLQAIDALFPCTLSNAEAFFSQKANEAYAGHCDSDDVLVIQIEGTKHWRVHAPQQRRYFANSPLNAQQMGPLINEFDMHPGDVLYVRGGVPHRCTTPSDYSLHISIDLCDRTPNIEQISHAANQAYNHASAKPNASTSEVVEHYMGVLKNPSFMEKLQDATQEMQRETMRFRKRIGNSSSFVVPKKLLK
jgi:ribosomal protein L16 Arg81 hydroxylase